MILSRNFAKFHILTKIVIFKNTIRKRERDKDKLLLFYNVMAATFQGSRKQSNYQCDFIRYHMVSFMIEDTLIFCTE